MATSITLFIIVIVLTSLTQFVLSIFGFFGFFGAAIGFTALLPFLLLNALLAVFLHYSCWSSLPAGYRKQEPLTAALLLLVPIFNLYWVFVTFPSLGRGFDQCLASNQLAAGMKKETLGTFYACALVAEFVTAWIPVISGLISFAVLVTFLLFYIEVIKASGVIAKMQGQLVTQPVHDLAGGVGGASSLEAQPRYVEQPGTPMQKLLRLAQHYDGQLSMAQMAMNTNFSKEELKTLLDEAQRDGYVEVANHPETGAVRYRFDVD